MWKCENVEMENLNSRNYLGLHIVNPFSYFHIFTFSTLVAVFACNSFLAFHQRVILR